MSSASPDPLIGRVIDGRYQVTTRVARGGMATVYKAIDRRLDRVVALKIMHPHLLEGTGGMDFVSRFRREAQSAARLAHPGLVAVFDQGSDGDISYLAMEFVDGSDLRRYLTQRGSLPLGEALDIAQRMLAALSVAHNAQLVHRDIKPENVMMTQDGGIKVADFGLARAVSEVTATTTGTVMGTVAYLAPEVITTGSSDARTDIYAVGIVLYEMIAGKQPHGGESAIQIAYQHVNTDTPSLSDTVAWLPPAIVEVVRVFTARNPHERPADAVAALKMLQTAFAACPQPLLARRHEIAVTPAWDSLLDTTVSDSDSTTVIRANRPGATSSFPLSPPSATPGPPPSPPATKAEAKAARKAAKAARKKGPKVPLRARLGSFAPRRAKWLVLFLALLTLFASWYLLLGPGSMKTVPEGITNVSLKVAQDKLKQAHIESVVKEEFHDSVSVGNVVSSTPAPGKKVGKNEAVSLVVSKGPRMTPVPSGIVGVTQKQATEKLASVKLAIGQVTEQYSDTVAKGSVIATSIDDKQQVRHDTQVTLTVSLGPEPVNIPNVVNTTATEAKNTLTGLGLKYAEGEAQYSNTTPQGSVISQTPVAGTAGLRTDTVTVVISKGHEPVTVPDNYYAQNVDQAKQRLEELGFKVTIEYPYGINPFNQVLSQSAKKGDVLPYGSSITLKVF